MTFMTVHTDEQPPFLTAKTEVFPCETRQVKLDGLFVFRLLHHQRAVEFVMQWIAHGMRTNALWHGLKIAVEDLSKTSQPVQAVYFCVHQRHTDRCELAKRVLKFPDTTLLF